MKKVRVMIICAVIAALAIVTTGSLALFTAEGTATNVITTGGIALSLVEQAEKDGELVPFEDVVGVLPGQSVSKIVSVNNDGEGEAFVRIAADIEIELAEGVDATPDKSLVSLDFDETNWTLKDGYWYYNKPLAGGKATEPLFTAVTFAENMGNEYQNGTIKIIVTAQSVQTANNGTSALDATGWPEA